MEKLKNIEETLSSWIMLLSEFHSDFLMSTKEAKEV